MFEWQRHSQSSTDVPHYSQVLEFINLQAQASEAAVIDNAKKSFRFDTQTAKKGKAVASLVGSADTSHNFVACKSEKHPLYNLHAI